MEIFDCFCGVGPWWTRDRILPYQPEEIIELMDHFAVSQALVHSNFTTNRGSAVRGNQLLLEACRNSDRLQPALTLPPFVYNGQPDISKWLDYMKQSESKAIWLVPNDGNLYPWLFEKLLPVCVQNKIPVFLHRDKGSADDINRLCQAYPGLRLILVGCGYGDDWWLYPLLEKHQSLHICLGHFYIPAYGPMRFLQHFPAERLLFGSGLPFFSPGGLISHVNYADIEESAKEKILSGNIKRLLSEVEI